MSGRMPDLYSNVNRGNNIFRSHSPVRAKESSQRRKPLDKMKNKISPIGATEKNMPNTYTKLYFDLLRRHKIGYDERYLCD